MTGDGKNAVRVQTEPPWPRQLSHVIVSISACRQRTVNVLTDDSRRVVCGRGCVNIFRKFCHTKGRLLVKCGGWDDLRLSAGEASPVDGTLDALLPQSDIETGIGAIYDEPTPAVTGIYDLSGRRVGESAAALNALPAGIYVVNGKKVFNFRKF